MHSGWLDNETKIKSMEMKYVFMKSGGARVPNAKAQVQKERILCISASLYVYRESTG